MFFHIKSTKSRKFLYFALTASILSFAVFLLIDAKDSQAISNVDGGSVGPFQCVRHGAGDVKSCRDSFAPSFNTDQYQTHRAIYTVEGQAYGGVINPVHNLFADLCFVNGSYGPQEDASSTTSLGAPEGWCQNVVAQYSPAENCPDRNSACNNWDTYANSSRDVGSDFRDFNEVYWRMGVRDAAVRAFWTPYGRRVSIDTFFANGSTTPISVNTGQTFNMSWTTDQADLVRLTASGSVVGGGTFDVPNDFTNDTWTASSTPGTITMELRAWGPTGTGRQDVFLTRTINVVAASLPGSFSISSLSCFGWPTPRVEINWGASSGATGYSIYRRVNGGANNFLTSSYNVDGSGFDWVDSTVSAVNTYEYQVRATNANGTTNSTNTRAIVVDGPNCGQAIPGSYTLTVTKNGTGSGSVNSAPSGISCGGTCSANYTSGTIVTLTATPSGTDTFAGWSGGGCSGTGNCVVTLNANTTVTATFNTVAGCTGNNAGFISQTINGVSYNAGGSVTLSPSTSYPVSITMRNTCGNVWLNGVGYALKSQTPANNLTWGTNNQNITTNVFVAANYTFNFTITTPASANNYNFQWQMAQNATFFGAMTPNVVVTIPGPPNDPPLLGIDNPLNNATVSGTAVWVSGIAIDSAARSETGVSSVIVSIDGTPVSGNVANTINRSDVCLSYGPRPGCPNVGYIYYWNTTLYSNGTHTVSVTATDTTGLTATLSRTVTVSNAETISVNVVKPASLAGGGWDIATPGGATAPAWSSNQPVPALITPVVYTNRTLGSYTLTPTDIAGYNFSISPSSPQTLSLGTPINWTITYTLESATITASAEVAEGSWRIDNNLGVPVDSGSGTTPKLVSLPVTGNNYTFHALPATCCWATEGVRYNGTLQTSTPRTFTVTDGGTATIIAEYHRPPPAAPSGLQLELSQCGQLRVSWIDNANNESGFQLYYGATSGTVTTPIPGGTLGPSAGTGTRVYYTWTTPPVSPSWIGVASYINYPPNVYSTTTVSSSAYTPQACYPDLSQSSKNITSVNGGAFNTLVSGQDGDLLTFRITIQNSGTDRMTINSIQDTLRPNLISDGQALQLVQPAGGWNLRVDKNADGAWESGHTITPDANFAQNGILRINVSGVKCTTSNNTGCSSAVDPSCVLAPIPLCNNWTVYFDARVQAASDIETKTEAWNEAEINYTYNSTSFQEHVESAKYLLQTGKPKVPDFREIAP